jgi:hypothetical protein
MSKGSRPRPYSVPLEEVQAAHEAIFGKKPPRERYVPPPLPEDMQNIKSSFEQQMGTNKLPDGRT